MADLEAAEVTVKVPSGPVQTEFDLGEAPVEKVEAAPEIVEKQEKEPTEGVELLRRQLKEKEREADEAKRMKYEAEIIARQRELEAKSYQVQAQDNNLTAFNNAIASFERDAEMLERDYATVLAEGDYAKAAKLQRQMAQVESKLVQLAQGRESLEERLKYEREVLEQQRKTPEPRYQEQESDPIEAQIRQVQSPASQAWLRSHRDVLADPDKTALMTAAHWESVAKKIQPDSAEYFSFIESKVYGESQSDTPPPQAAQPRQTRQPMAAAPVSRTNSAQALRSGQSVTMTLTPAERQAARDMDMSDEEYLEGKLAMIQRGSMNG